MRTQKYTIEVTHTNDGTINIERICDGFNAHELLGHLWVVQQDLFTQLKGKLPEYKKVSRKVVKEGIEESKKSV